MRKKPSASPRLRVSALTTERLSGLILAGGKGERFGGPKAFATLDDGRTFLESCAAMLVEAGASPVVATLPPGTGDPRIADLEVIALRHSGMDMFGSLKTGLRHVIQKPEWLRVAVLPVDHPLVRCETVVALASHGGPAVIPSHLGKHGHPVCLDREVASAIADGMLGGPTLRDVLRASGAAVVEVDDPGVIANCNTPAALRAALRSTSNGE